ncbi:MAG: DUF350 domain-containing protein [Planctomycetaceae bacterium]
MMPTDLLWSGVTGVLAWAEGPVPAAAAGTVDSLVAHLVAAVVFSLVGIAVLFGAFTVLGRLVPFSIRKEIEHDQNVALAIIMAAIIVGISLIIAAAILG